MLVEFYEDYFEENPSEKRKEIAGDGVFHFTNTGDPQIDKWEREIAQGLTPDLTEGMTDTQKEELKKEQEAFKRGDAARQRLLQGMPAIGQGPMSAPIVDEDTIDLLSDLKEHTNSFHRQ